jgi:hypothetical protein
VGWNKKERKRHDGIKKKKKNERKKGRGGRSVHAIDFQRLQATIAQPEQQAR